MLILYGTRRAGPEALSDAGHARYTISASSTFVAFTPASVTLGFMSFR